MLHKRARGDIGEEIACSFLTDRGFGILDRNYQRKWGELDIIASKNDLIHFFEVKSITRSFPNLSSDAHTPEENVDGWKVKHLRRIIETYLDEKGGGLEAPFQFHVLCVYMNTRTRRAKVKWLENIIL